MDHAWSNSFLFLEKKNFNVSRSMFRIYFRKFVVYNGYKCYDDRKINSRRVASYSNIYLRNLNINRRNACLLPLDRWYLYASTHLFQICTVVRAKQIFLLLLNFEIHFSNQILPFKSGRKSVDSNIFSNIQLRSIWGGGREEKERGKIRLFYDAAQLLWFYFNTSNDQHRGLRHFIFDLLIRGITRFRESATFLEYRRADDDAWECQFFSPSRPLGEDGRACEVWGGRVWISSAIFERGM